MVNYDIHWNPVRLMQRIGRVDRRMNPEVEDAMVADHPEFASPTRRRSASGTSCLPTNSMCSFAVQPGQREDPAHLQDPRH